MSIQPARKTHIKDQARDWGVKDTLGQLTIDRLVEQGQKMRAEGSERESEILATLRTELDAARSEGCVGAFLNMDCESFDMPIAVRLTFL